MLRTSWVTAIGVATLIGSGVAMATDTAHAANNEAGSVYHGAEYAKVEGKWARVDKWNMQAGTAPGLNANDPWEYIGGEAGWELRQHRYDFVGGRLVHSDTIPHDTPRPTLTAEADTYYREGDSPRPR